MRRCTFYFAVCFLAIELLNSLAASEVPVRWFDTAASVRPTSVADGQRTVIQDGAPPKLAPQISPSFAVSTLARTDTGLNEMDTQRFEYMNSRPFLRREGKAVSDGPRIWSDTIFAPEVVRFKHLEFSGSLLTAMKRKNPLCLLHPLLFRVGW